MFRLFPVGLRADRLGGLHHSDPLPRDGPNLFGLIELLRLLLAGGHIFALCYPNE